MMTSHFSTLVEMLRDTMGEEGFNKYCAFAVGAEYTDAAGSNMIINARGNIEVSIRMLADLIDLTAYNFAEHKQISHGDALTMVLGKVQKELTSMQREVLDQEQKSA